MKRVLLICVGWNVLILFLITISPHFLPLQNNFLGAIGDYVKNPVLWSHANFDGDHFIEIARHGYGPLEHFYFPLYPLLIRIPSTVFGDSYRQFVISGVFISIMSTFVSLVYFLKLTKFEKILKNSYLPLFVFLFFPTSFYLQLVYSEALFISLVVCSFYYARKGNFALASFFAAFASGTRLIGLGLCIGLLVEWYLQKKPKVNLIPIMLSFSGFFYYLFFLYKQTGDALVFLNKVSIFGDQRSSHLILFPQVVYRYIFKIFPHITSYWPASFITTSEFIFTIIFGILLLVSYRKIRLSYWIYMLIAYLLPTLSGSFSSMPRYLLVLFPMFIYISTLLEKHSNRIKLIYFVVSTILLSVMTMMFVRGYWVS